MSPVQQKTALSASGNASKGKLTRFFECLVNLEMHGKWETEAEYATRKLQHPDQFHSGWRPMDRLNQRLLSAETAIKARLLGITPPSEAELNAIKSSAAPLAVGEMYFPLKSRSPQGYKSGGRQFGAVRDGGKRMHAGCDLLAPKGTPVYAMADGLVTLGVCYFWEGTYQVEIRHDNGLLIAYREIASTPIDGIEKGKRVKAGQLIAYLTPNTLNRACMVHLEMFKDTAKGPTSQRSGNAYKRRSDIIDPTPYLDAAKMLK